MGELEQKKDNTYTHKYQEKRKTEIDAFLFFARQQQKKKPCVQKMLVNPKILKFLLLNPWSGVGNRKKVKLFNVETTLSYVTVP